MLYKDFKESIKSLGFLSIEDFMHYAGVTSNDVLNWEEKNEVPYMVSLILHLLKGEKELLLTNSSLDSVIEECLPLASLLEEVSSFPHKLEEMFLLQKKLNDSTNGANWELCINKFGKEINWLRCIHMEVAELIESTPWKHWKNINSEPDMNNIHVELVDIWHFYLSQFLKLSGGDEVQAANLIEQHYQENVQKPVIFDGASYDLISLDLLAKLDLLIGLSAAKRLHVPLLIDLVYATGMNWDFFFEQYVKKNILNIFKFGQEFYYETHENDIIVISLIDSTNMSNMVV